MAARFRVRWLAAWRDITKWRVYWLGAWREIVQARRYVKTGTNTFAWKTVYLKSGQPPPTNPPPTGGGTSTSITLGVTAYPTSVSGTRVGTGTVYTNAVQVTATKGTPPYTYTWVRVSYSGSVAPSPYYGNSDPAHSKVQFSRVMSGTVPEVQTGRFKCVVKDSVGNKGSVVVDASFYTTAQAGTGGDGTVNNPPTAGTGGFVGGSDQGLDTGGNTP